MRALAPVLFLLLGACAAFDPDALPVCDGQARRPANPHGSVLSPPADSGAPAAPAAPAKAEAVQPDLSMGGCA